MGEIRNARCLLLQQQWNQYGDPPVDPICRSLTGSITPITTWILYADHQVDPMGRSLTPRCREAMHQRKLAAMIAEDVSIHAPRCREAMPAKFFVIGFGFDVSIHAPRVIDRHYGATDDRRIGASLKR